MKYDNNAGFLELIESLEDQHVIKTMFLEHKHLLSILGKLEIYSEILSDFDNNTKTDVKIDAISSINQIIAAEPHHKREEEALFPILESKGVIGAPHCMREEHEILRELKRNLKEGLEKIDMESKSSRFSVSMKILDLSRALREHIKKENSILYPLALEIISPSEWIDIKDKCDRIGYCYLSSQQNA